MRGRDPFKLVMHEKFEKMNYSYFNFQGISVRVSPSQRHMRDASVLLLYILVRIDSRRIYLVVACVIFNAIDSCLSIDQIAVDRLSQSFITVI